MVKEGASQKRDLAWKNRVLCSDGACIGVIGPDRRCRECGRMFEGELPETFDEYALEVDEEDLYVDDSADEVPDEDIDADFGQGDDALSDDEWAKRILCSDESCIGVVGPDGCCKDCGKPYHKEDRNSQINDNGDS